MLNPIAGEIFHIDKPLEMTSFLAVKKVRNLLCRKLGMRRMHVGHAGTLDPLASGVLIVCTGRKTKQIDTLQAGIKEYIAWIRLGETTPSFDMETEVDASYPWEHITRELIEATLQEKFTGTIEQVPPAFSACKVDGKPAYKLARKGRDVTIRPKTLVIDEIELLECNLPQEPTITVRVVCSKGTYIRALARDIGEALDSGAHLYGLRRTRVGDIRVEDCESLDHLLDRLSNEKYVPVEQALEELLEQERIANRERAAAEKAARKNAKDKNDSNV
ncbi:MAG: tRNA pseudouridine(55) synthase TruB [Muribaculaceae bacterium]|nr:tRNA pseudouridine(55) synthase TruB [Muribaculaceae bacterium]